MTTTTDDNGSAMGVAHQKLGGSELCVMKLGWLENSHNAVEAQGCEQCRGVESNRTAGVHGQGWEIKPTEREKLGPVK